MTSNDNVITVEIFNNGIAEIKSEINSLNQRFDRLESLVATEIRVNETAHSYLQSSINTGFTTIGIIIGIVGLIIAVVGVFKKEKNTERSEELSPRNIRDIRALIREEFSMLNPARAN